MLSSSVSVRKMKSEEYVLNPNEDRPPKVYETPYFPDDEHREGLNKMYDYIENLVPKEYKDEATLKRDEYLKGK